MTNLQFIYDLDKSELMEIFPREAQDYLSNENIVNAVEHLDEAFSVFCEELDCTIDSDFIRSILENYKGE